MGKAGCFKIMSCGGADHAGVDDMEKPEAKPSLDRRRWSFSRKSSRNQSISNLEISEPSSVASSNKESLEISDNNVHPPEFSHVSEEDPEAKFQGEIYPLSSPTKDTKIPDAFPITNGGNKIDYNLHEPIVIIIQTAVRGYLAKKQLQKHKKVVKLQASVRGHLVRRQAVGTLRCVQAIVKMQALVRARHARQCAEKLASQEDNGPQAESEKLNSLGPSSFSVQPNKYSSTEKLLRNGFARLLLESTPKTKPIYISCDHLRSDSAWTWLERWMALASSDVDKEQERYFHPDSQGQGEKTSAHAADEFSHSTKNDEVLIVKEEPLVNHVTTNEAYISSLDKSIAQAEAILNADLHLEKITVDIEKSERIFKGTGFETLEIENKQSIIGSRKPLNPAFAAVKSKFEELSATSNLVQPMRSHKEFGREAKQDRIPSFQVNSSIKHDIHLAENAVREQNIRATTSDCSNDSSVLSTFDSSDRSEAEGSTVLEIAPLKKKGDDAHENEENVHNLNNNTSRNIFSTSDETFLGKCREEMGRDSDCSIVNPSRNEKSLIEQFASANHVQPENVVHQRACWSSPQISPVSDITRTELHETKSCQISMGALKIKGDNNDLSATGQASRRKRSPSKSKNNSSARSSMEYFPKKGPKDSKKKSSLSMVESTNIDLESKVSSSGKSLPSYMQATESARAKFNSSPVDSQENDNLPKKRHSLPIGNGKKDSSPRMQRSTSQVQSTKEDDTHSPVNSSEKVQC